MLIDALICLIRSFDDEDGLPEKTYKATDNLIQLVLGQEPAAEFRRTIDATDGRFYLKPGTANNLIRRMFQNL